LHLRFLEHKCNQTSQELNNYSSNATGHKGPVTRAEVSVYTIQEQEQEGHSFTFAISLQYI